MNALNPDYDVKSASRIITRQWQRTAQHQKLLFDRRFIVANTNISSFSSVRGPRLGSRAAGCSSTYIDSVVLLPRNLTINIFAGIDNASAIFFS